MLLSPRAQRYLTFISGFPRLSDGVEVSTSGFLSLHRGTKFIIRFDFAVTLSSLASSCVLFDIAFRLVDGTEMADVERTQKMIPFVTCEISLGQYVCELVFGVNVFDLDFWGPNVFCQTTNPVRLCGFWKHVKSPGFFPL